MPPSGAEIGAMTPDCDEGAIRDAANLGPGVLAVLQAFNLIHLKIGMAALEHDCLSASETRVK